MSCFHFHEPAVVMSTPSVRWQERSGGLITGLVQYPLFKLNSIPSLNVWPSSCLNMHARLIDGSLYPGRGTRLRACGAEPAPLPFLGGRSDRPPGRRSAVPPGNDFFQYSNIPAFHYSLCLNRIINRCHTVAIDAGCFRH